MDRSKIWVAAVVLALIAALVSFVSGNTTSGWLTLVIALGLGLAAYFDNARRI